MQAELVKLKPELKRTTHERDNLKNGRSVLSQAVRVKYAFIQTHRSEFRFTSMCPVPKVHRSGYQAWLGEPLSARQKANEALSLKMHAF